MTRSTMNRSATNRSAFSALTMCALFCLATAADADVTLTAAGSTALLPLVKASADLYQSRHPDAKITVSGGGSRLGVSQVAAHAVDMGMSDTVAAGYPDLVDHRVCVVGFSVLVNPGVGVTNLTKRQLADIFAGKVANWKEVGGADLKIIAINRPRGSGTRLVFAQAIMGAVPIAESGLTEDATAPLLADIRTTPGAISYAAFTGTKKYLDGRFVAVEGVRELSLDGAAPSEEDIGSGKYPLWSYEHIYTNGQPSRDASRFLALVESNGETIHELGFILLRDMKVGAADR